VGRRQQGRLMKELQDYSGAYKPDIKFEDFSKEALIRLIKSYQISFVGLMGMWHTVNMQRMSAEEASNLDAAVYERMVRKFALPMVTQALNIKGDDVVTMLKYSQFCPDGSREGLYEVNCEVKNNNHVILTYTKCPTLFWVEKKGTEKDINCLCGPGGVEERAFAEICKYFNPKMKSRALKLPPRKSKDDICCIWEFKVD
jgi:hypothetical protein